MTGRYSISRGSFSWIALSKSSIVSATMTKAPP